MDPDNHMQVHIKKAGHIFGNFNVYNYVCICTYIRIMWKSEVEKNLISMFSSIICTLGSEIYFRGRICWKKEINVTNFVLMTPLDHLIPNEICLIVPD